MRIKGLFLSLLFVTLWAQAGFGQDYDRFERGRGRITYESLVNRSHVPRVYFDYSIFPETNSTKNQLLVSFKIEYDYLMFKRSTAGDVFNYDKRNHFSASAHVTLEVFKADRSFEKEREKSRNRRKIERRNLDERLPKTESVARGFWKGTVVTPTYELTQSHTEYLEGYISLALQPGNYDFILQIKQPDVDNEHQSRVIPVHVPDFAEKNKSFILMLNRVPEITVPSKVPLLNFGNNVYYGKDFDIMFLLPQDESASDYDISVHTLNINRKDTTTEKAVFNATLKADHVFKGLNIAPDKDTASVYIDLKPDNSPFTYGYIRIPNSQFPNAIYRLTIKNTKTNKIIAQREFQSQWINMPTSLLNLRVATEMMKFIVSKKELKDLETGSFKERKKKFDAYWKKRDPTPKTQYNELMAEYYRRIDYTFNHFTTPSGPGYDKARGKIYIQFGPPESIERKYPPNQPSIEIWKYPGRQFIFQATTGFGDYELVK